jgi:hypothetical protein
MSFLYSPHDETIIPHVDILKRVKDHIVAFVLTRRGSKKMRISSRSAVCPMWIIYVREAHQVVREILQELDFPISPNDIYNFQILSVIYFTRRSIKGAHELEKFKGFINSANPASAYILAINVMRDETSKPFLLKEVLTRRDFSLENLCMLTRGPFTLSYRVSMETRAAKNFSTKFSYSVEPESVTWITKSYLEAKRSNRSEMLAYFATNYEAILRCGASEDYQAIMNIICNTLAPEETYVSTQGITHHHPVYNMYQEISETILRDTRMWRYVRGDKSVNHPFSLYHEEMRQDVKDRNGRVGAEPIIAYGTIDRHWAFSVSELTTSFSPIDNIVNFRKPSSIDNDNIVRYTNFLPQTILTLRNFILMNLSTRYLPVIYEKLFDNITKGIEQRNSDLAMWDNVVPDNALEPFVAWLFYLGLICKFWTPGKDWHAKWNEGDLHNAALYNERSERVEEHLARLHPLVRHYPGFEQWLNPLEMPPFSNCRYFTIFPVTDLQGNILDEEWNDILHRLRNANYCLSELAVRATASAYYYIDKVYHTNVRNFLQRNNILGMDVIPDFDISQFDDTRHVYIDIDAI